jgi:hypothetical protein
VCETIELPIDLVSLLNVFGDCCRCNVVSPPRVGQEGLVVGEPHDAVSAQVCDARREESCRTLRMRAGRIGGD